MATSYRTTDNHVETLTCSICLNVFTDPRILPCIHTFCKTCLLSYIQTSSVNNRFPCPLCRNETQLPKDGIDGIKHNFYIEEFLHQFSNKTLCDTHPGEGLRLYCVTCCVRICRECKFQKHDEHKSRLFSDLVEEKIQSLKDTLEIARPEALAARKVLDCLKIREAQANTAAESCIKQIAAHVEQMHDDVDSLADELIEQMQTDREWTVANLKTDIKVFTEYITSFNDTEKSVSEIASGKDETWDETFLLHSELEESLNNLRSPNTHHKSAEDATLWYFNGTIDKAALKAMVGTVSHTNTGCWMNEGETIDQVADIVLDENGSHEEWDSDERTEQRNHAIAEGNNTFLQDGQHGQKIRSNLYVTGQPDASKVRVTGPGVEHGILANFISKFVVDTRGAGAGQLIVHIRGPKGGFQFEMYRDSQKDRTVLCHYDPRQCGLYIIAIKWSGVDVPGSPFSVHILATQQELEHVLGNDVSYSISHHGSQNTPRLAYAQWRDNV